MKGREFTRSIALWAVLLCLALVGCVRFGFDQKSADAGKGPETSQPDASQRDTDHADASQRDTGGVDAPLSEAGPQPPPIDEDRSSPRFKRLFVEGDGVRQYTGWYDVQLKQPCRIRQLADGTVRCLPLANHIWSTNSPEAHRFYADDTCTESLWAMSEQASEPLRCPGASMSWMHFNISTCTTGLEMLLRGFRYDEILFIGAKSTSPPQTVYSNISIDGCVEASPPAGDSLYEMIPIDYKTLPEFEQVRVNQGKRLDSLLWQAADGTAIYQASLDTLENMICQLKATTVDGAHCIPVVRVGPFFSHYYTDDQCTEMKVGSAFTLECDEPQFFTRTVKAQCDLGVWEVFVAGTKLSESYYLAWDGVCTKNIALGSGYQVGAQIALSNMAAASYQTLGTGRLHQVYLVADGLTRNDHIYDTLHQVRCSFTRAAADGKIRCLPIAASSSIYYMDATCTQPVAFLDCPNPTDTHYLIHNTLAADGCSISHVHRTLGAMSLISSEVYRLVDGSCTKRNELPGGMAVELSSELAPSDFVDGVEGME